jgi:histidyl-tRNA synthetase
MIEAKIVKGFRDALPAEEQVRLQIIQKLGKMFDLQGYQPIDTPILEYAQTLLGKSGGESEKQMFRFTDAGKRDVAMRFDLTVPLARYVALHKEELAFPFKRYHIAKVWRGEKPQRGRFREFYQCDFDLVGADSVAADLDIILTAYHALRALGVGDFVIEMSHRGVLLEYLTHLGVSEHNAEILRAIDKVDKIGWQAVSTELEALVSSQQVEQLQHFLLAEATSRATLEKIAKLLPEGSASVARVWALIETIESLNLSQAIHFNPKITRGLDYYTGMVFETFLSSDRALGSICSGGRYDDLLALYSKTSMSGVGGSIGLDRLLSAESTRHQLNLAPRRSILIYHHADKYSAARQLLGQLHDLGMVAEIYPEEKKIETQTKYAEKKGMHFGIFMEGEGYTLRCLVSKTSQKGLSERELLKQLDEQYFG